ncbi:MAG: UvrD-helicase domain-containing protein [Bacteroidales bacterium]|nr:UvrD-helicase domain-containing protein [Bacteroidales bacterium]
MEILVFAIILVVGGFLAVAVARMLNDVKTSGIESQIDNALEEWKQICNVDRICTDEELSSYVKKHEPLRLQMQKLCNNFFVGQKTIQKRKLNRYMELTEGDLKPKAELSNRTHREIEEVNKNATEAGKELIRDLLRPGVSPKDDDYLTFSRAEYFKQKWNKLFETMSFVEKQGYANRITAEYIDDLRQFRDRSEEVRKKHNEEFVEKQLTINKDYFENALSYPLDEQQRKAIVDLEDACLVISGAGCGKTSTMVGKVRYLTERREVPASKILVVTYTRKAAAELSSRLCNEFLSCVTFHSLAIRIIGEATGKKPTIAPADVMLNSFYFNLGRPEYRRDVVWYVENYMSGMKDGFEYETASEYYKDRQKYGVQANYRDMDGNIIFTKSEEEKKICNFLTHMGVQFRYEEKYEYDVKDIEHHQYKPDFTIYYKDSEGNQRKVYYEHFGINENGEVPKWFGDGKEGGWREANRVYNQGIVWKKGLHESRGTTLVYTTSADFHSGKIERRLKYFLEAAGVPTREVEPDELYKKMVERNKSLERTIMQTCTSFIYLAKANRKSLGEIIKDNINDTRNSFVLQKIIKPVHDEYCKRLQERDEIDFTDSILQAAELCQRGLWKSYEYILVDEFQDISVDRYEFLKALRGTYPMARLFCVGDDWQSIYRFNGSDVSLFTEFSKYFGFTDTCRIETTYRFGQPAIQASSDFVQKNPVQLRKEIRPTAPHIVYDVHGEILQKIERETKIDFFEYDARQNNLRGIMEPLINRIDANDSICILGRYSFDVDALGCVEDRSLEYDAKQDTWYVNIANRKIKFLTVHAAKGLEAQHVFLINCNSGLSGFPSLMADDPVQSLVLSQADEYEHGEERRVFYVAITRAKKHTYILYDGRNPSPFVKEMNDAIKYAGHEHCPVCREGYKILFRSGVAKNGSRYKVMNCSNWNVGCTYNETVFE